MERRKAELLEKACAANGCAGQPQESTRVDPAGSITYLNDMQAASVRPVVRGAAPHG